MLEEQERGGDNAFRARRKKKRTLQGTAFPSNEPLPVLRF